MAKKMAAADFKAHCLQVMEDVRRTRGEVVITKRGVPVAKLVPMEERERSPFDCGKGTATIVGDIVSPVLPAGDWHATK
jgi:prevent-host-death family protein